MLTFTTRKSASITRRQSRAKVRRLNHRCLHRLGGHREGARDAGTSSAKKERRADEGDEWSEWTCSLRAFNLVKCYSCTIDSVASASKSI